MTKIVFERKLYVFGLARVDARRFPLTILEFMPGKVSEADFKPALEVLEAAWRTGQKSFQVTDLSQLTEAPAGQRKIAGDFTERTYELQRRCSLGGAVVAPNAFVRGVLTAVHWLKKPPAPTLVCATRAEAIAHATSVVEAAGLSIGRDAGLPAPARRA